MASPPDTSSLLTIQFTLSPEEAKRGKGAVTKAAHPYLSFWPILLLIVVGLGFRLYQIIRESGIAWLGILVVIWIVIFMALRAAKRRQSSADSPITLEILSDGLIFLTSEGQSYLPWASFSEVRETPEFFLIHQPKAQIWHFIPRRAFPSEQQSKWFAQVARDQIGYAAGTRPAIATSPLTANDKQGAVKQIRFTKSFSFADCLDAATASWLVRGIWVVLAVAYIVAMIRAVFDDTTKLHQQPGLIILAMLPCVFLGAFFALVTAVRLKFAMSRGPDASVTLSGDGVAIVGSSGNSSVGWEFYDCYKETRRNFIFWRTLTRNYVIVPKRLIPLQEHLDWLRRILRGKLRRSTWFLIP